MIQSKRVLPLVLVTATAAVVVLYMGIQIVAMGTLPGLAGSKTPLSSAAVMFLGPTGGLLLTIGAVLSTTGTDSSALLVGSRMLHALAEGGHLPPAIARVHPRYRTPVISIVLFAVAAWAFAISGTFAKLAGVSALARLLFYASTCMAVPVLRRRMPDVSSRFTLPGGFTIPLLALGACFWLLTGSDFNQLAMAAIALVIGAILYWWVTRGRRSSPAYVE